MGSVIQGELLSHLSVLYDSASSFPSQRAFLTPNFNFKETVDSWNEITYASFVSDVEKCATRWTQVLSLQHVSIRSVVGLWIPGFSYSDLVLIYGISRAGYIPQLFSIRLANSNVIFELLSKTNARALIYDGSFSSSLASCPIPHFSVNEVDNTATQDTNPDTLLPRQSHSPDDVVVIFHTSGSTSGSPKLVKCTARWLSPIVSKAAVAATPRRSTGADVTVWMGSLCHIAQFTMLTGFLLHGSCTVQPSQIAFSSDELQNMIQNCELNRLNQFSTFISRHFRNARENASLLADLQSLDAILFSGLPLPTEDEQWGYENGLKLTNIFGSTEAGAMMLSIEGNGPDAALLRPIPGTVYAFEPVASEEKDRQLLELIILPESPDCPAESFRSSDGKYHTGDLFIEVKPCCYSFCGRNDDWIKSENSLRCDTRAIEQNVLELCGDLVENCIVVGTGRPSPALFVESSPDAETETLKQTILKRIQPFHERLYLHERITSPNLVLTVPVGSLPRTATKGNIRRQAVETSYKTQLDGIYRMLKV